MGEILNLRQGMREERAPVSFAEPSRTTLDPLALLLADIAAGSEPSFARLYELTAGRLLSIARGIVGGRSDVAEDILQESFIRVWRWAHRFDPGKGMAYAWLVRIVRNRALSAREQLHRREDGHGEPDAETLVAEEIDPADRALQSEQARRVKSCLANLPANHRRSVSLVYFEGLTHRELAERLGVQLGTAKSWVRRGLAQMGRCLSGSDAAPADMDFRELVAAEYAVGSLQGAVGRGFERRRERDARYCRAVDRWEDRLAFLTETLPAAPVSPEVWNRIRQQVARERVGHGRPLLARLLRFFRR
ncbi:MAG TPA: sigma-70 family RNA polymerase sigma factor [Reyranella sp.]|jgi:RNA polymerase sigma-70 factor (ECF subfamily)|nr:sigma-70 family RNA polymerase sigma factor [Reyranella sp.]